MRKRLVILASAVVVIFGLITAAKYLATPDGVEADTASNDAVTRGRIAAFWTEYRKATSLRMGGRYEQAARSYEKALELNERHEDALYYVGNMYLALDRPADAEAAWQRLIAVNPRSARGHARLGDLYLCVDETFNLSAARTEHLRAHEINREETGPILRLGQIEVVAGNVQQARAYLDAVLGANTSSLEALLFRGYLDWKSGRADEAAEPLLAALASDASATPEGMSAEGDTRDGMKAQTAERKGCEAIDGQVEDLKTIVPHNMGSHVETQFEALDTWVTARRP